jgi:hypothetical protein
MADEVKHEAGEFEQTTTAIAALKADVAALTKENQGLKGALVELSGRVSRAEDRIGDIKKHEARVDHLYKHLLPGHTE